MSQVGAVSIQVESTDEVSLGKMNHFELLEYMRHYTDEEVAVWKEKVDFNELEFKLEERRQMVVNACSERFRDQYVSVMIAEYSRNLFDGEWRTTNRVVLYELENEDLVGYFQGYLLLGKVFGDEILFHQYCKSKQNITVHFQIDVTHNKLDGHFYTGKEPTGKSASNLEMYRAAVPYYMAMKAVQHGDLARLEQLRKKFKFDFNQALPEANNFTILHNAVTNNQPDVVRFLVANGVDLEAKNSLMQTAFDLAIAANLTTVMKCFPKDFVANYNRED